jgi:hypothetical protein
MIKKLMNAILMVSFCFSSPIMGVGEKRDQFIQTPNDDNEECIQPIATFSYSLGDGEPSPKPLRQSPVKGWTQITSIPNFVDDQNSGTDQPYLELIQRAKGQERVWIIEDGTEQQFYYFETDSGIWVTIKLQGFYRPHLFKTKDENIWIMSNPQKMDGLNPDTMVLGLFDEDKQEFISKLTLKDFPDIGQKNKIQNVGMISPQSDSHENFWFFLSYVEAGGNTKYQLYSYSPETSTLKQFLSNKNFSVNHGLSMVVDSLDNLFLLGMIPTALRLNGGEEFSSRTTLFKDKEQRLWINDKGWLDIRKSYRWNVLIQSPIFVVVQAGSGLWRRDMPTYSLETEDGKLWFSSYNGTGWMDPIHGKWCLYTSYQSKVVVDSGNFVWTLADGKLYKKKIIPIS